VPLRITNSSMNAIFANRINLSKQRLNLAQERITTGKKINAPSDDPSGAEAVLRLNSKLSMIERFQESASTVKEGLRLADGVLESYQQLLDRATTLMTQGSSDSTSATAKAAIATEIEGIRKQMISIANLKSSDRFVFGGTRQNVAPFDANGNPAATSTSPQMVQLEPDAAPVAAGAVAESIFSNAAAGTVFSSLAAAATALRGTGDPVADKAAIAQGLDSVAIYTGKATNARSSLGASMIGADAAQSRLDSQLLLFKETVERFESADIAAEALALTQASQALEATIQASAFSNKGSLMDLIG
jgi:flagellar hook-associated protein 3 FlgL